MPAKIENDTSTYGGRFAQRLRELRADKDVEKVLKTLAKNGCEIGRATYYNWEAGRTDPPFDSLPALAKALGCKIADLFPET